jgi:hypothetical protein
MARKMQATAWSFNEPDSPTDLPYQKWYDTHIARRIRYGVLRESLDRAIADMIADEPNPARAATLQRIAQAGTPTLMQFLDAVATLAQAQAFAAKAHLRPADVVNLLRHIYRRILPQGAQMRQLVADTDTDLLTHIATLKQHGLSFSLALLDRAHTRSGRAGLSKETGIPAPALLDLVLRADLTRLWLMGGGMVRISWALGYRGLRALQQADPDEYYPRCVAHYHRIKGKPGDLTLANCHSHIARMRQAKLLVEQ